MTVCIKAYAMMFISTASSGNIFLDEKVQSQGIFMRISYKQTTEMQYKAF